MPANTRAAEGRLRARSATAAHGACVPAPTRGAASCAAGGGGGVCARRRFLPRTGDSAAGAPSLSGFSQALRGVEGVGSSSAGQDRERDRLLVGLLGGLSSRSSSEGHLRRRRRGMGDVGALGDGGADASDPPPRWASAARAPCRPVLMSPSLASACSDHKPPLAVGGDAASPAAAAAPLISAPEPKPEPKAVAVAAAVAGDLCGVLLSPA